jgi:ComF family protein
MRAHLMLFPAGCRACGALLQPASTQNPGLPYVCASCHALLPWRELHAPEAGGSISASAASVTRVWAPWRFEEPVRGWIHGLKYEGRDGLAIVLGRLAAASPLGAAPLHAIDLIAPVPLHRRRLRERGFNQAALIAHQWRRGLLLQGARPPRLVPGLLRRTRYTTPQVQLDALQRHANVAGAFGASSASPALSVVGKRILLVDDVMTTGATMAECARVLLDAGAGAVDAWVLAKTG